MDLILLFIPSTAPFETRTFVQGRIPSRWLRNICANFLTTLHSEKGEFAHRWPQVLPDHQAILFSVYYTTRNYDDADIEVPFLKTGERKRIYHGAFFGRYLPSGHLVFIHQNTLFASGFDVRRMPLESTPQPVIESIANSQDGVGSCRPAGSPLSTCARRRSRRNAS